MSSEMVERVARAIAASKRSPEQRTPEVIDRVWAAYCGQARAAIAAMREPVEAMKMPAIESFIVARTPFARESRELARDANKPEGFHAGVAAMYASGNVEELFRVWRAMIDAALSPTQETKA